MGNKVHMKIIKNKRGEIRSGWLILLVFGAFYMLQFAVSYLIFECFRKILISTGDINPSTWELSTLAGWINEVFLPVFMQIVYDVLIIAAVIAGWKLLVNRPLDEMGLIPVKKGKKDGLIGMLMGIVNCSLVLLILLLTGQAYLESWKPEFNIMQLWGLIIFVFVAFGEELFNRSFLMSVLRRTGNIYAAVLLPSVFFGLIHLGNPGVTLLSVLNIILAGMLFSYMYIKSGNVWMCIGYHFTWNLFQGVIYGLPVSGLAVEGVVITRFTTDNLINGGRFGIEGGLITTLVFGLGFLFVKYYYRNVHYDFISNRFMDNIETDKGGQAGKC